MVDENRFRCAICNTAFQSQTALDMHLQAYGSLKHDPRLLEQRYCETLNKEAKY
ncbi:MAG: C2H2-type zinc finger protein [Candidatus Bathyarchaeia archaeon]|jgi:hypothetical protein